jgi:ComF family protein
MIPMPLSRNRQRERGFNQALEIARPLSRWTGVRLAPRIVARIRDTPPQASLPWRDRARNIRGAFTVTDSAVSGRRVVVIDDVMTTGASLAELARALKSAGALHVENWLSWRERRHLPATDHVLSRPGPPGNPPTRAM